jgi:spore coat protein U-like protein
MRRLVATTLSCGAVLSASPAAADTTGTIGVSLTVTSACAVNGAAAVQSDAGRVAQVSFPDQPGLFGDTDAEAVAAGASGALSVLCSPGITPALTIGAGAHDFGGRRRMSYNGSSVAYRLFTDAARTSEIAINQRITLPVATSTATLVPIYARVNSAGTILAAGTYTDTVQVLLSW